jgi:hypothetical protein
MRDPLIRWDELCSNAKLTLPTEIESPRPVRSEQLMKTCTLTWTRLETPDAGHEPLGRKSREQH